MTFITEQLLQTSLVIHSKDINQNIDNIIKLKLKENIEGKCSSNGYVLKDTIKIIKRNLGEIKTYNGKSQIKYLITYRAKLISLSEGDEINVFVNNINKMGVLAYVKLDMEDEIMTSENSPLIVMVPKEYFSDSSINFDDVTIGKEINVKILGKRDKFMSDKIQSVARPI